MAEYQIPPWLHGQDIVGSYNQGVALGQRAAAMKQQADADNARLQMEQEQSSQRALERAHETAIKNQQDQINLGLRRQAIEQRDENAKAALAQKAQQVKSQAAKAATQFAWDQQFNQLTQSGTPVSEAIQKIGLRPGDPLAAQLHAMEPPRQRSDMENFWLRDTVAEINRKQAAAQKSKATKSLAELPTAEEDTLLADLSAQKSALRSNAGKGAMKPLDRVTAAAILKEAGGDKAKAREMARERGYTF